MDVSNNRGGKPPKMDGENHGKPYEQMDDLGGFSHDFWFNTQILSDSFTLWQLVSGSCRHLGRLRLELIFLLISAPTLLLVRGPS